MLRVVALLIVLPASAAFSAAFGPSTYLTSRHSVPVCTQSTCEPALPARRAILLAAALAAGASPAYADELANRAAILDSSEDHNASGAPEKHIPTVKLVSSGGTSGEVLMTVPHVMDPDKPHFIELLWFKQTGSNGQSNKILASKAYTRNNLINNPSVAAAGPSLKARVKKGTSVTPMLYCNLHGVWEGEPFLV